MSAHRVVFVADVHKRIRPEQLWPELQGADLQALAKDLDMRPVSQVSLKKILHLTPHHLPTILQAFASEVQRPLLNGARGNLVELLLIQVLIQMIHQVMQ